jgi:ABC-type transporter Mla MlaB component
VVAAIAIVAAAVIVVGIVAVVVVEIAAVVVVDAAGVCVSLQVKRRTQHGTQHTALHTQPPPLQKQPTGTHPSGSESRS